jgi:hypothetical protein
VRSTRQLTPDQAAILTSRTFRDYLDTAKAELRIFTKNVGVGAADANWKAMFDAAPADKCVMVMKLGDKQSVVDLPADTAAAMKAVADFSGATFTLPKAPVCNPPVFTAEQWKEFLGDGRKALVNGQWRYFTAKPRDKKKYPYGAAPGMVTLKAAGVDVIPRKEWPARLAALKKANAGVMPLTYGEVPCSDQNGLGYCWVHSAKNSAQTQWYTMGMGIYELSAVSVGGPLTNYQNEGGWPADAVRFIQQTGAVGTKYWPENALNRSYASKPEVKADYPRHMISSVIADLGSTGDIFAECVTVNLLGGTCAVSFDWWGHAIIMVGVDIDSNGKVYGIFRNSWGADYGDNGFFKMPEGHGSQRGTPDDAQAVLMMKGARLERPRTVNNNVTLAC